MNVTDKQRSWSRMTHALWVDGPMPSTRKPVSAAAVTAETNQQMLDIVFGRDWLPEGVGDLPEFTDVDLWGKPGEPWWNSFVGEAREVLGVDKDADQRIVLFILNVPEGRFVINTEGYDYCRYATRLVEGEV
jgi:hypothetical protein